MWITLPDRALIHTQFARFAAKRKSLRLLRALRRLHRAKRNRLRLLGALCQAGALGLPRRQRRRCAVSTRRSSTRVAWTRVISTPPKPPLPPRVGFEEPTRIRAAKLLGLSLLRASPHQSQNEQNEPQHRKTRESEREAEREPKRRGGGVTRKTRHEASSSRGASRRR